MIHKRAVEQPRNTRNTRKEARKMRRSSLVKVHSQGDGPRETEAPVFVSFRALRRHTYRLQND